MKRINLILSKEAHARLLKEKQKRENSKGRSKTMPETVRELVDERLGELENAPDGAV
jgi:hypothetical protein